MNDTTHPIEPLLLALRWLRTNLAARDRAVAESVHLKEGELKCWRCCIGRDRKTPTVLARRTSTHLATMTGVLTRLERAGWTERRPDINDRRSIRIHPTSIERFDALYADSIDELLRIFGRWSPEQAQVFLNSVNDIAQALEPQAQPGATLPPQAGA
ncbi:MarR family winged helix-turn-helix transcriptional regulator [Enemella evansiae]|uniref:MarR family winged helix-turn-helix transcriptional regulator n=1 Tax=Enemella evansiae TaxID=2016499 RepID=UPI000B97A71C|nr:MarR family transcriptional regulator [Enemella evansiae]OYO15035.1 MarR family transcriptional regulator [Enemella evansiae]TDO92570.1 DNA-binding MarR family transcriptional regulator [Enemella evansiae]